MEFHYYNFHNPRNSFEYLTQTIVWLYSDFIEPTLDTKEWIFWVNDCQKVYLTIIPRARMGYESIAHEAEGRMSYWFRAHEGERNNCFSKIQLVGQKNIETKHLSLVKAIILVFKAGAFRY